MFSYLYKFGEADRYREFTSSAGYRAVVHSLISYGATFVNVFSLREDGVTDRFIGTFPK